MLWTVTASDAYEGPGDKEPSSDAVMHSVVDDACDHKWGVDFMLAVFGIAFIFGIAMYVVDYVVDPAYMMLVSFCCGYSFADDEDAVHELTSR